MADSPLLDNSQIQSTCGCTIQTNTEENIEDAKFPNRSYSQKSKTHKMATEKNDPIGAAVGEFGKWQLRAVLLIFLCKIPSSWFMACILFTAPGPKHGEFFCKPPIEVQLHNEVEWIKFSHPETDFDAGREFNVDFCNVFKDAHSQAQTNLKNTSVMTWDAMNKSNTVVPCDTFQHKSIYDSIITQFDLVCSREILVAVTQFFHLFGVLLGGCIATKLLEFISPRKLMVLGMITQIVAGNLTGFAPYYGLHVLFRCMSAICCGQIYTAGGMIFTDITGGKYKTVVIAMFEQFWSVGVILLPGVASFFQSWTHIYMAISIPITLLLIFLHRWIPESPRWMIKRGYIEETKEILVQAAKMNGTTLAKDIDSQLQQHAAEFLKPVEEPTWTEIWEGPKVKLHLIACHLAWSIYIVTYYGMLLNIKNFGREYRYVNTIIAGLCEIIGTFIGLFLIMTSSNKWQWTSLFNIIGGFIAFTVWLIPDSVQGVQRVVFQMITAMVTKVAISSTLVILTTCTVEIVVPAKRKMAAYSTIVWARIWLLTCPYIGATTVFGQLVPQTAFAVLSIIGALITNLISTPRTHPKEKKNSNYPAEITPPEDWAAKANQDKNTV